MRKTAKFSVLLIAVLLSWFTLFYGQTKNAGSLPHGVSIHRLGNGIEVLLIENPASPMVGVNTVVKVGSAYETFGTSGMSHMLEHLLFNGTDKMTQKELYDAADKIGAYNNANTSEFYTNFMMVAPAENIEAALKIQAAMLFHSTLPGKKFAKEKGIVLEEIARTLANPQAQAERNINSILFEGHALSLPPLGTYQTIEGMSRDDVFKFYKNYYVPNNMVMSVIGNFRTADMLKLLEKIYGEEKPGVIRYPLAGNWAIGLEKPEEPFVQPEMYHRFYQGRNLELMLFYLLPESDNPAFYRLLDISLEQKSFDLQKLLEEQFPGIVSSLKLSTRVTPVDSYLQAALILKKDASEQRIADFLTAQLQQLHFQLSSQAIENAALKAITSFFKNVEKPHMFGIFNAEKFAVGGIEAVLESYRGEKVREAAALLADFTLKNGPLILIQHPQTAAREEAAAKKIQIKLFEPGKNQPALIVKQIPGSELMAVHYLLKQKSAYESRYGKNAAWLWHDAFGQRMQSDLVTKRSARFGFSFTVNDNPYIPMDNIYLDPAFGYIRVEGLADDIPGAIRFLNQQMLTFIPTRREFEKALKKLKRVGMMAHQNAAKKRFNALLDSVLFEPKRFPAASALPDYQQLLDFGQKYFSPANMIISVVSRAAPEQVERLFSGFGGETSPDFPGEKAYRRGFRQINAPVRLKAKGGGAQAYLYYGFEKTVAESDKPALQALSLLLNDRILFDIREKQGMAYRMSAGIEVRGEKAMFRINMATRPDNVDKLLPQFPEFFRAGFAASISAADLQKAVNRYLGRMMFRRLSSINQAYYLGHSYFFEGDIRYDAKFLNALKSVTLKQVRTVARKYLHIQNPVTIVVR